MNKIFLPILLFVGVQLMGQSRIVTDSVATDFIPYGVRSTNARTESTSSVEGKQLRSLQVPNLIQSLYGQLPGVLVSQISGEPGEENTELFIRGKASLLENIPLVLVDGIETSYQQIHWSEVEKVTVLRDASALALYGFRGANGVLMITTRRGAVIGKPQITFNARYGNQSPLSLPEFAPVGDYVALYNEARANDGLSPVYSQEQLDGYRNRTDPYLFPNVNWRNEVLAASAPVSDYTLTFRGGSQAVRYFLMLGYLNSQGLFANTDRARDLNSNINYDRYSFRSNVDVNISKELTVSLDLSGRIFQKSQPNININDHWKSMNSVSFFPVTTPDGRWAGRQGEIANPAAAVLQGGFRSYHSRELNETLRLHYNLSKLVPGLGVFGTAAFSSWFKTNYDKTRQFPYFEVNLQPGSVAGTDTTRYSYVMRGQYGDPAISQRTYWQWNRTNIEGGFDYNHVFGDHALDGMLIYHQNVYRANGVHTPFAQQRLMGRLHYGYRDTYFAQVVASYSGSDNFEPGKRFGFFPAASASWVMSNEEFLNDNPVVSYLKLTASTGLTGSDRLGSSGRWGYQQYYNYGTGITIGGESTIGLSNLMEGTLANPGLTWETAWKSDFSIGSAWFNNHIKLNAGVFYEKREGILVPAAGTRPVYVGVNLPLVNEGITENKGLELQADYSEKIGALSFTLGGNVSFIRSKVINKNEEPRKDDYRWETGHPIGTIFGLEAIGFFADQADIDASPKQLYGTNKPGDIKYRDMNNDKFVDDLDMKAIGKSVIPELIYAINGEVKLYGIDFSWILQGVGNRSVLLSGNMVKPFVDNALINEWAAGGRWTAATASTATYPRLSTLDNANNYKPSTFWLRDGSFLRLKNIELGYTLPATFTNSLKIESCRFYLSGSNLWNLQQFDEVRVDSESMDINRYPLMKTISAGMNLTF